MYYVAVMRVSTLVTPDGAAIVTARKAAGIKAQRQLARLMCVEPPVLCRIEQGVPTRPVNLMAIAHLVGVEDWQRFVVQDSAAATGEAPPALPEAA